MIVHLHSYNENHRGCAYCAFQKLKRARNTNQDLENGYLITISNRMNDIINEISIHLNAINTNNILLTNIATNNLIPLGTIMDSLEQSRDDITIIESLLIKTEDVSFGRQANMAMSLDEKRVLVQFDKEKLNTHSVVADYEHYVFIDDVYDSGNSYQIAKEKLMELGVLERDISLITILIINNID